ncbi:MAG: hypothetical protein QOK31_1660 [Solirubrobacteraceae bacterium]|jgi:hypothetical protein|nr:hypothetical protein [Solirubrobacteraceae bacterium]
MIRRGVIVSCALAPLVVVSGCGVTGDERAARHVTDTFLSAVQRHDGPTACGQLSEGTVKKLVQQDQMPCEKGILSLKLDGASAGSVRVYITSARATVAGGDRLYLDRGPNGWKISAAGCKPQPQNQPDDCDLED